MSREQGRQWLQQWGERLGKYKYALLILVLGVALMLVPAKKTQTSQTAETVQPPQEDLEARLEALLSQVEGAGRVQVLLTLDTGPAYEYQTDVETRTGAESERRTETVIISGGGSESAIPIRTTYPTYKGAVVVCEGADSPAVKLDLIRAVSSLTGLGSDKISVIKMKSN